MEQYNYNNYNEFLSIPYEVRELKNKSFVIGSFIKLKGIDRGYFDGGTIFIDYELKNFEWQGWKEEKEFGYELIVNKKVIFRFVDRFGVGSIQIDKREIEELYNNYI